MRSPAYTAAAAACADRHIPSCERTSVSPLIGATIDSMRRLLAPFVALVACGAVAPSSSAAGVFQPCRTKPYAECARVDVPLDRSGRVPGTIGLHVERLRARDKATGAVFALAGGPGQSSAPLLRDFSLDIPSALRTRDLIAIDQRGTGGSGLLRCPTVEGKVTPSRAD